MENHPITTQAETPPYADPAAAARKLVELAASTVRLLTRNGHHWTKRFPWIVQAVLKNRAN